MIAYHAIRQFLISFSYFVSNASQDSNSASVSLDLEKYSMFDPKNLGRGYSYHNTLISTRKVKQTRKGKTHASYQFPSN